MCTCSFNKTPTWVCLKCTPKFEVGSYIIIIIVSWTSSFLGLQMTDTPFVNKWHVCLHFHNLVKRKSSAPLIGNQTWFAGQFPSCESTWLVFHSSQVSSSHYFEIKSHQTNPVKSHELYTQIGVPPNHPNSTGIFHFKLLNHPFRGTPMAMETPISSLPLKSHEITVDFTVEGDQHGPRGQLFRHRSQACPGRCAAIRNEVENLDISW